MLFQAVLASIVVLSSFEGGSVGKVEQVSPTHLRCAVEGQADQDHRNRQASWYYFEIENLPKQAVTVELVNIAGEYNYHAPAFAVTRNTRPVYSYDGVSWRHFRDDQVSWNESGPSLILRFQPEGPRVWIAHVQPYTNRHLASLLDAFRSSPFLENVSAGRTVEGREIPLLTITNPKTPEAGKKVIWLMFRQHAWEAGSSWVCDGALRFLLSGDPRAVRLRDQMVFKIFPMADPDGVFHGGVRFNRNGYDLNRNWDAIDPRTMPEIASQHRAMLTWVDAGHRVDAFLSLHNTERGEYLEATPGVRPLAERILQTLKATTTFNPTGPLADSGSTTTPGKPGRMHVGQGLYHERKLPAMLMEQMVEFNSKLGRCPTAMDRTEFGGALVRVIAEAVQGAGE
jgi:murein tripeptide amidase MpaA